MSWICVCGFDHVWKQELGNFCLILRIATWNTGFFEGVWGSDLLLGLGAVVSPHLWVLVSEGCRSFTFILPNANILPRVRHFSQKFCSFNLILSARVDPDRPCDRVRRPGRRCWVDLGQNLGRGFGRWPVVWPDVLLQLCLGKCPWMVCCCHTSFNSVPSFY